MMGFLAALLCVSGSPAFGGGEGEALRLAQDGTLRIEVRTTAAVAEPLRGTLHFRRLASEGTVEPESRPVEIPGTLALQTPMGVPLEAWVEMAGWWSPRRLFVPGKEEGPLTVAVFPSGFVSGAVAVAKGEEIPKSIEVRFDPAADTGPDPPFPGDSLNCPVREGRFECALPAVALDLRLRARGFVSHYLWSRKILRGRNLDLGKLALRRGNSVVGRVEAGSDGSPVEGASVVLEPDRLGSSSSRAAGERMKRLELSGTTGKGGFFQLVGVQEGQYRLRARKKGIGEALAGSVRVMENAETRLAAPLRLFSPATVEVRVEPPRDPLDQGWRMSLESFQQRSRVQKHFVPVNGEENLWRTTKVPQGEYWLLVKDSEGSTWASQEVKVAGESLKLELAVDFVPVRGQVTLDGEPLAARLTFGGRNGLRQLRAKTEEDGTYVTLLPEGGPWRVDIEAREPEITQQKEAVDVGEPGEDGWVELDFALEDRTIEGELQDSGGRGIQGSVILTYRRQSPIQTMTDDEGRFVYHGLSADIYHLQGIGPRGATTTEPQVVELDEEDRSRSVILRLTGIQQLEGRIVSRWGPVPGAHLGTLAETATGDLATMISAQAQTGPDGSFALDLPTSAAAVTLRIEAPGYGLAVRRIALPSTGSLELAVFPEAGSLVLEGAEGQSLLALGSGYFLRQNGLGLSLGMLLGWQGLYLQTLPPDAGGLVIPMMEFGDYELCRRGTANPPCSKSFLPPGGEAVLALPGADEAPPPKP
jgi:hypothetical protein